jgi:hypothetical protein
MANDELLREQEEIFKAVRFRRLLLHFSVIA